MARHNAFEKLHEPIIQNIRDYVSYNDPINVKITTYLCNSFEEHEDDDGNTDFMLRGEIHILFYKKSSDILFDNDYIKLFEHAMEEFADIELESNKDQYSGNDDDFIHPYVFSFRITRATTLSGRPLQTCIDNFYLRIKGINYIHQQKRILRGLHFYDILEETQPMKYIDRFNHWGYIKTFSFLYKPMIASLSKTLKIPLRLKF